MRDIMGFSTNVLTCFENKYENIKEFAELAMNASNRIYTKYDEDETNEVLRNGLNAITGIDFKAATPMKRRQALRLHGAEVYSLIEDVIADRMKSGFTEANAKFMAFVEEKNIADGDKNEFFVKDNSLLTVSKFAGNHHDVVRQKVQPGKAFSVDTSWYVIKVYADYEAFQLGRIDFAEMVDRMYKSIEQYRYAALFTAFMSLGASLPSDMKADIAVSGTTVGDIVDVIEAVKAATGSDVLLVGARPAIQKLQGTVSYDVFSDSMKDEKNQKGILGKWEGYDCLALDRVNLPGTRTSIFSAADNKKLYILPVDPEFKPIKRVNEGDVIYTEAGTDGNGNMDMTVTGDVRYQEGLATVIDELFGLITITN